MTTCVMAIITNILCNMSKAYLSTFLGITDGHAIAGSIEIVKLNSLIYNAMK